MVAPFLESEQLGSQIRPSDTDVETGQPRMNAPTRYKYLCSYVATQPTTTVKQPDTGASLPVCEAIEPMSGIHQATPAEFYLQGVPSICDEYKPTAHEPTANAVSSERIRRWPS